jgi:hypothetical protein
MKKNLWEVILLIAMAFTLIVPPLHAIVDANDIKVQMRALTTTDVVFEQDVLFEVTVINQSASDTWVDLWFTFTTDNGIPNEKRVTTPYMDKESPLSGPLSANDEVKIQLRARPLENVPIGPYIFNVKTGIHATGLVDGYDSFRGIILDGGDHYQRGPGDGGDEWMISSVWAMNDAGREFLSRSSRTTKTVNMIQNYPNPFNPETNLTYEVRPLQSGSAEISLDIYNVHGHLIRYLVDGSKSAGIYSVKWDGRDNRGVPVQSGIYIFKLQSGRDISVRKGILTR